MFVATIALKYALLVSQWSYGHFLKLTDSVLVEQHDKSSPFDSTRYIVSYPRNGDRIVTIDFVWRLFALCIHCFRDPVAVVYCACVCGWAIAVADMTLGRLRDRACACCGRLLRLRCQATLAGCGLIAGRTTRAFTSSHRSPVDDVADTRWLRICTKLTRATLIPLVLVGKCLAFDWVNCHASALVISRCDLVLSPPHIWMR